MSDELKNVLRLVLNSEGLSLLPKHFNDEFKTAFLSVGSETSDNLDAVRRLNFGSCKNERGEVEGFKIKDKDIMISDVINALEGIELPEQVKTFIPDLDQEDLDAALRLATMILGSLENHGVKTDQDVRPKSIIYNDLTGKILVVDDDADFLNYICERLQGKGHQVLRAESIEEGRTQFNLADVVLLDVFFINRPTESLQLLTEIHQQRPDIPVIMLTVEKGTESIAVKATREGAFHYIKKTLEDLEGLMPGILQSALAVREEKRKNRELELENAGLQQEVTNLREKLDDLLVLVNPERVGMPSGSPRVHSSIEANSPLSLPKPLPDSIENQIDREMCRRFYRWCKENKGAGRDIEPEEILKVLEIAYAQGKIERKDTDVEPTKASHLLEFLMHEGFLTRDRERGPYHLTENFTV